MMRKPETTDETRHSVAEHKEIEELLNDLAATPMSSGAWMTKFRTLNERYLHHIDEEEQDWFPKVREGIGRKQLQDLGARMLEVRPTAPTKPSEPKALKKALDALRA